MKFEEKLMKLRKNKALSQEELGEQLNVTRQTISKWELGQSKPDMNKLIELSKFFNVSVESLADDTSSYANTDSQPQTSKIKKDGKTNNFLLPILIICAILIVVFLAYRISSAISKHKATNNISDQANGFFDMFSNIFEQATNDISEQLVKDDDLDNHNKYIDSMVGVQWGISIKNSILDDVIKTNSAYPDNPIVVIFNGQEYSDTSSIASLSSQLSNDFSDYLVQTKHDDYGYITTVEITKQ